MKNFENPLFFLFFLSFFSKRLFVFFLKILNIAKVEYIKTDF